MLKKWISCLCAAALAAGLLAPGAAAADELSGLPCAAYIVMDADSGQVLMEKNADEVRFPASITKIMTMALAMEKADGNWDQTVTVSHDAVHQLEFGSSHIALMEDEYVRLEDVLYGTEMASANDGANVLAEFISEDGTIQGGVDAMNQKAAELGLTNTHYMNPHGLHDKNHYTTAREMAEVTRWALTVPGFEEVFSRNEPWVMEPTNKQPQQRTFRNTDWMRISGDYKRDYARGSKNGFHDQSKTTFVNYAVQGDVRLISVELGCEMLEDKFKVACAVLDYAFAHFHPVAIPAPQDTFLVELVGGGGPLGSVTVKAKDTQFLLHDSLTAMDVNADYSIPEQYVLGQPFSASVQFTLRENDEQPTKLGSEKLEVEGLPQILKANTYIPQSSLVPQKNPVGVIVGVTAAALLALLAVRFWYKGKMDKAIQSKALSKSAAQWDIISRQPLPSDETVYLGGEKGELRRVHAEAGTQRKIHRKPGNR